ncbi:UDP-glucose 6-dehydrogenase [Anaerobacillus alkalidiazotrophicus]|uniref:UDP-glucose 6-dehydrogenase n=1 Tax=Anaerobacillus alkalidiazotrophicus TaxID=472963 RepID=A0A1S2M1Z0_9BACI|nr:UDP-glucose/GDP-mannose dehydrogenase family protein [Anaerobacillus alkalidiazotrophicus]OIJ18759.1 UDP-glucose 6-dehydrogenase [Anaerobacillus alkalidiazotrophicus]
MKVCVIGTGYVGLTTGTVLADYGHDVYCIDKDQHKLSLLNKGKIPIYEPGLQEMVNHNKVEGRLHFSNNLKQSVNECSVIVITVGTPPNEDGSPNLTFFQEVINDLSEYLTSHKTIIVKSTVPPGTNEWVEQMLLEKGLQPQLFDIVSNPEFLREGSAVHDMLYPDKIVIGIKRPEPIKTLQTLYYNVNAPFIITSLTGAELIKYASNAFLATKISFINEIARICDAYHVDIKDISLGLGTDPRIGPLFLNAGLGYGGSCFPKDVQALQHAALKKNIVPEILKAVQQVNDTQIDLYFEKLVNELSTVKNKKITVWGLAFKPETDDTRFSRSLRFIDKLVSAGAIVHAYDPIVHFTNQSLTCHTNIYESIVDADAVIVATEWSEFKNINWKKVKDIMKGNVVIDGRNFLEPQALRKYNIKYIGVARP